MPRVKLRRIMFNGLAGVSAMLFVATVTVANQGNDVRLVTRASQVDVKGAIS